VGMKTSKISSLLFTLFFVFLFMTHAVYAYTEVNIDGKPVAFTEGTGYPYVESGRTLVPLRITMESFGADVSWDNGTKTAFVVKGPVTVRCSVGGNSIYRNNVKIPNDASAVIKDGRTYLPIRAVLEAFGAEVGWDVVYRFNFYFF
ncbi:MAG: copper amine oxidase N-terminal domain-containing protein, partial [Lachnospiraceae bacterium]|nr:copper amine oxidase N-terminal domain-containing protein [Lachnospiraceae bacterium]